MTLTASIYAAFQGDNPEQNFNDELIDWRSGDDPLGYLEDVFRALEVVPGVTFKGVRIEEDESKFPPDLTYMDIEPSRMNLAQVYLHLEFGEESADVTLSLFLPKLIDGLFYFLGGSLYYPILQLVDRSTYVTKKTLTLKTLLMPLVFRRDTFASMPDIGYGKIEWPDGSEAPPRCEEMIFTLDLFRAKINVFRYMMAAMGLKGSLEFMGAHSEEWGEAGVFVSEASELAARAAAEPGRWRAHDIKGANGRVLQSKAGDGSVPSGLAVVCSAEWLAEDPGFRGSLMVSLADALEGSPKQVIRDDDIEQWKRRLGRHFTQNANTYVDKADKILLSLRRILDGRTKKNLAAVPDEDKEDVFCILRWMMRNVRALCSVEGMDVCNKRIRVTEYMINPILLRFSDSTYRLLNSKSLNFKSLMSVFKPFIHTPGSPQRPQAGFLLRKIAVNDLLRYVNMVNNFDIITALRWTTRGPQSMGDRGGRGGDISLRFRGHHESYVGRISLASASASDPGTSGTLVPFARTDGQFFLRDDD